MSTPDAKLNAAERAALAGLEAAAVAADPHLADRLRGGSSSRTRPVTARGIAAARRVWASLLAAGWAGTPLFVAGVALMLFGLGTAAAVSMIGAVAAALGLRLIAESVERRLGRPKSPPDRP
jgi:hypothetical protein